MKKCTFNILNDTTLLKALKNEGLSYKTIKEILRKKDVLVGEKRVNCDKDLKRGETITFYIKDKPVEKVYEDDNFVIVNKKSGIEVKALGKELNLIPLHRLDRNTTGLVVFGKNLKAEEDFKKLSNENKIEKYYVAEVLGNASDILGEKSAYLFKDSKKSLVYIKDDYEKGYVKITTQISPIKITNVTSLVSCKITQGKTHQIRSHLKHLKHAILGDNKYGNKEINRKFKTTKQKLHCYKIKFLENNYECFKNLSGKEIVAYPKFLKEEEKQNEEN